MTQEEYEERRRALEQELQSDLALIHAAYEARNRSLDRLRQLAMEENGAGTMPIPINGGHDRIGTAPQPVPAAPAASRKPARPPGAFLSDLDDILSELPEVFDKRDVIRLVGYEPTHPTFFRALNRLQKDGTVAIESYSDGGKHTRYRKLAGPPGRLP